MELSFSWPVLVTPPSAADLARDLRLAIWVSVAARIRTGAREFGALRKEECTPPEGISSNSGEVLQTSP